MSQAVETTVTFRCGHTADRKLHGSRKDRERAVLRLKSQICDPCDFMRERFGQQFVGIDYRTGLHLYRSS